MRRLSPVRGRSFVCRCAPRHTPSLKRARSRVGYVSMPARIHISARRSGVEKRTGDSSPLFPVCVYRDVSGISLSLSFCTRDRFRYSNLCGKVLEWLESGGKFSVVSI